MRSPSCLRVARLLCCFLPLAAVSCGYHWTSELPKPPADKPVAHATMGNAEDMQLPELAYAPHEAGPIAAPPDGQSAVSGGILPAVRIDGSRLVDGQGQPVQLHGFNWFGFNDGTQALGGLWSNEALADFAHTVHRQKLLGFNAVRLPFSFSEFAKEPKKVVHACPDLTDEDIARSCLGDKDKGVDASKAPKLAAAPKREPGQCNGYIEGNTVREQLIWTVKFFVDNGFYVLVDDHYREDMTVEQDQRGWVQGWSDLAHALLSEERLQGRVFFDLLNEPEQYGQMWEPGQKVGLRTLYIAAMDAIDQQSDKAIYFLEGTGHSSLHANWGDGYCTDAEKVRTLSLSDIRPFLTELAQKPYRSRVVLAPHVYGPAVTYATADFAGSGLFSRLNASFGTLTKTPFEAAGQKLLFPVAIGEFGSHFTDGGDKSFMGDFAQWLKNDGAGKDDKHEAITSWFYWCWGANSGDTGGLVQDDWTSLHWQKIEYLEGLGLTPWHKAPASAAPVTQPHTVDVSWATASSSAANSATATPPSAAGPSDAAKPIEEPKPLPKPDAAAPAKAEVVPTDGKIHARIAYNGEWETDGKKHYVYNLHLTNATSDEIKVPYDLEVSGPAFVELGETWNLGEPKLVDGKLTAKVTADWAALPAGAHGTTNVGFIGLSTDKDGKLKGIKLAGKDVVLD